MDSFYISLAFGGAAACANVVGGLLVTIKRRWDEALLKHFVALRAGFMLGAAFLGMMPESIRLTDHAPLLLGYLRTSEPCAGGCAASGTGSERGR